MTTTQRKREDKLFDQYQERYAANDLPGALDALEKLLKVTNIKAFIGSFIVDVLIQMNRGPEALQAATEALRQPNPPSKLYQQHAQLLLSLAGDKDDLQTALNSVETAISLYNSDSINEDVSSRFESVDNVKFWLEDKARSRQEMNNLRSDIKGLIYSLNVYDKVQQVELNVGQEKIKTIELMAIFTAIIALIFANVQFLRNFTLIEMIVANLVILVSITWLLYLVHRISLGSTFLPSINTEKLGSLFGTFILLCLVAGMSLGIVFLGLNFIMWFAHTVLPFTQSLFSR